MNSSRGLHGLGRVGSWAIDINDDLEDDTAPLEVEVSNGTIYLRFQVPNLSVLRALSQTLRDDESNFKEVMVSTVFGTPLFIAVEDGRLRFQLRDESDDGLFEVILPPPELHSFLDSVIQAVEDCS